MVLSLHKFDLSVSFTYGSCGSDYGRLSFGFPYLVCASEVTDNVSGSFLWRFLFLLVRLAFALLQASIWYLSRFQTSVSAVFLTLQCFLFALRLISSVHGSLFQAPSLAIIHRCHCLLCLWVLQGPSPSVCDSFGSKVPLATRSPIGTSPFFFSLPLRLLLQ